MCRWDELPQNMQVKEVKRYYDILQRHKASLILKRLFDRYNSSRCVACAFITNDFDTNSLH